MNAIGPVHRIKKAEGLFLKFGIITRNQNSWCSTKLQESLVKHNISCICFSFPKIIARAKHRPMLKAQDTDLLQDLAALIIRPIGRGSIEELVFRLDILYRLQRFGSYIINSPEAIEHCVDKYDVITLLEENNIPVPRTAVTENIYEALNAFKELDSDVIVKPLFGSRGIGATRIMDSDIASTVFKAITFYHGVIYLQEYVPHGYSDIRVFVVGDRVVASMRRVADNWKTNYSQGACPESIRIDKSIEDLAIKSARVVGCRIAGVDVLESQRGPIVLEVNSQPGWKGLQSVTSVNIADEIIDFILSELRK